MSAYRDSLTAEQQAAWDASIAAQVEKAPPLSDVQLNRLASLMWPPRVSLKEAS